MSPQLLHILDGKSEHEQHQKLDMEPKVWSMSHTLSWFFLIFSLHVYWNLLTIQEDGQPRLDSLAREKEALSIEVLSVWLPRKQKMLIVCHFLFSEHCLICCEGFFIFFRNNICSFSAKEDLSRVRKLQN